ncbi:MAG: TetR/AcrR family transcriptional regulator [Trueperaceae bacterium]
MTITATATRQGRRSGETAERTKEDIIKAALGEFAERGFGASSLRDIAKRAGTTHGLIRHHFGSKDNVFKAGVDYAIGIYGSAQLPILYNLSHTDFDNAETLIEAHKKLLRAFARISAQHPEIMRILMLEAASSSERLPYIYEQIAVLDKQYQTFFARLTEFGVLKQFDHGSCFLFLILNLGFVFGLTHFSSQYVGGHILDEAQVEEQADRIIATLYPEG